jgi:DNA-binding MurR/RpiR family transcriptional regulator
MNTAPFFPFQFERLSELSPAEQAVYPRLQLVSQQGRAHGRCEDLAKLAHVSVSTFRRARFTPWRPAGW